MTVFGYTFVYGWIVKVVDVWNYLNPDNQITDEEYKNDENGRYHLFVMQCTERKNLFSERGFYVIGVPHDQSEEFQEGGDLVVIGVIAFETKWGKLLVESVADYKKKLKRKLKNQDDRLPSFMKVRPRLISVQDDCACCT